MPAGIMKHGPIHSLGPVQSYPDFSCALLRHGRCLAQSDTHWELSMRQMHYTWELSMRQMHCCPFCMYQLASLFTQQAHGASYPLSSHARG